MDPLADYTALSPHLDEPPSGARRGGDEEATSQQCSADSNAFAGLRRPHSVVVASTSVAFPRNENGRLCLAAGQSGSVSQLSSQLGHGSQPTSQFHEAFVEDTQNEPSDPPAQDEPVEDDEVKSRRRRDEGGGGFLSTLEDRWAKTKGNGVAEAAFAKKQEERSAELEESNEDEESIAIGAGDNVDDDAATLPDERVHSDGLSDADSDDYYRRDSMDSYPDTQPLEDFEERHEEEHKDSTEDDEQSTEAFADTIDVEAMAAEAGIEDVEEDAEHVPATPDDAPTTTAIEANSVERKSRYLKRKLKARETLPQANEAFVDTEDQTLVELAARIQQERAVKENQVGATEHMSALQPSPHEGSQQELTPTQPSSETTNALTHVALKKREKANHVGSVELSASQERPYEFVDSSCRCGEAVCVCAAPTIPAKSAAKPSSAMRNLEFSFAIPESQDSESQLLDSIPDLGVLALKTLQAGRSVDLQLKSKEATSNSTSLKRSLEQTGKGNGNVEATPKKPKPTRDSSPLSSTETPPSSRKRGRTFLSPDAGTDPPQFSRSREVTPSKKSPRTSKPPVAPAAASVGSSTPSVRTRPRILSPVPTASSRSYLSRSKSLFKAKFEFCLTGFTGDGQENLTRLIEDYGGKVCGQDVLQKRNSQKVVVIATPVSWRKLKFMYAVASGIPVVHPEWVHACIKEKQVVPFDGYCVPSGCSVITGKFECLPVKELDIFEGVRFGIPFDVNASELASTRSMSALIAFILRACGADEVVEDLNPSHDDPVDIVLADEHTKTCDLYVRKHHACVKTFAWVTECMILQRYLEPNSIDFTPPQPRSADTKHRGEVTVVAATAQIGDSDSLKLHTGELLLVDLSDGGKIDHFLLFDVCEILSIRVASSSGDTTATNRKKSNTGKVVKLQVGVLERRPYSPALIRNRMRIVELTPEQVKRRVVAVSKPDFEAMKYRDESIFYYDEE